MKNQGRYINGGLTPYDLSQQRKAGESPHATIRVTIPSGKSERLIETPLTAGECLKVASSLIQAAALLIEARE